MNKLKKLEIIIKDNCEVIDLLVANMALLIKDKQKSQLTKKDRYWEGFTDGKENSLNHNIILLNAQLKSNKEFGK